MSLQYGCRPASCALHVDSPYEAGYTYATPDTSTSTPASDSVTDPGKLVRHGQLSGGDTGGSAGGDGGDGGGVDGKGGEGDVLGGGEGDALGGGDGDVLGGGEGGALGGRMLGGGGGEGK